MTDLIPAGAPAQKRVFKAPQFFFAVWTGFCLLNLLLIAGSFYQTVARHRPQGDLELRWAENLSVYNGINPYVAHEQSAASGQPIEVRNLHGDRERIAVAPGGYPPWSFITAQFLVPPLALREARLVFAAINLAAVAAVVIGIRRIATSQKVSSTFVVLGSMCVASHAITVRLGQYGLLINALLLWVLVLPAGSHQILKGLLLAVAAVKPQIAGLFFFIPLLRKEYLAVGVAALFLVLESAIFCGWTSSSVSNVVQQMFTQSSTWQADENGLVRLLLQMGTPLKGALSSAFVCGILLAAVLLWKHRSLPVWILAAIPAVLGRLWTYHRRYDDCMLMFLLLPLLILAIQRGTPRLYAAYTIAGISLWLPLREPDQFAWVILLKIAAWCFALTVLLQESQMTPAPTNAFTRQSDQASS